MIDQALKFWAIRRSFFVLNDHVYLNYGQYSYTWYVLWLVFIIAITMFTIKYLKKPASWFLLLILTGAISNMIDRLYRGGVVDHINSRFLNITFNLADVYIIIGVIASTIFFIKSKQEKS